MDDIQQRRWLAKLNQHRKQDPEGFAAWLDKIERTLPEEEKAQNAFMWKITLYFLAFFLLGLPGLSWLIRNWP